MLSQRPWWHRAVSGTAAAAIAVASIGGGSRVAAGAAADYRECQAADDAAFRQAIEKVTISALTGGLKGVDYTASVNTEWQRLGLDGILDKRVDIAVEEVRSQTSFSGLVKSLADQQKAQELATAVAERVYKSEPIQAAISSLATGVGTEVGKRIETATRDASGPALDCLSAFLGPRYGAAVAAAVTGTAGDEFNVDASKGSADVSRGSVLKQSSAGITGAAILIMRRQLANMAGRIGQRVVGSVLARVVSVAAGGVGLVLLAKDIWDLRHGVLPIVSDEMKSADSKAKVRAELAKSLEDEIGQHVQEIGTKAAGSVVEVWQEFRSAHAKALELADNNLPFKSFLEQIKPAALPRLDEITALVLGSEGESGVLKRLDNGTLQRAIDDLEGGGLAIARETKSIDTALDWHALAGDRLESVVERGLYQHSKPDDFTRPELVRLLDLNDAIAIPKLARLGRDERATLIEMDSGHLIAAARALSENELSSLAAYMTGLSAEPRARIMTVVAEQPTRLAAIAKPRIRQAILASADQTAAVDMMLRAGGGPDAAVRDVMAAWQGKIEPLLLWEKHPVAIATLGIVALFVLLWLRRLFTGSGPRPSRPDRASTPGTHAA